MAKVRGSESRAAGTQAQFVQGFLAAVRSMAKDCIPSLLPPRCCQELFVESSGRFMNWLAPVPSSWPRHEAWNR